MAPVVLDEPLARISKEACEYPSDMLNGCETGLLLFCAAFLGINDGIHMARRQMVCTCVDVDADRLAEMEALYPLSWRFWCGDAWEFARSAAEGGTGWDAVSVDTWTGTATDRSMENLKLWCYLANKCVTATIAKGQRYTVPEGWRASLFPRSPIADWLVLRRD